MDVVVVCISVIVALVKLLDFFVINSTKSM